MIDYDDYFGGLTEEEYVRQTEEHFKWLENNMRDATLEELQSVEDYVDNISKATGINLYDLLGLEEPSFTELKNPFVRNNFENKACENCSSNPKNGGTGICFCTLGQQQIIY